jgi:outer membrane protein insertion porin family
MKAGSRFLNAVSAITLSASIAGAGLVVVVPGNAEAAVIRRIDVRGANRVGADTVKANVTINPGKNFDSNDIDASVKRLYSTGYFSDVRITVSGGTLIVSVKENELLNQVVFNGNNKLKDEKLAAAVRSRALGPYSESQVEADIQSLKAAYAAIGRNDVTITTKTFPVGNGRLNLAFEINEGDRTKIEHINFSGNHAFGDARLHSVMMTKESGILTLLTRQDVYDQSKLNADLDLLRQFYYNHGYADFRIVSSSATLNDKGNEYTIDIAVDEGERYTIGNVNVESTVPGLNADDLKKLVVSRPGNTYDAREIEKSVSAISKQVASLGYPFARVTPRGNRDVSGNTISVDYLVDQGERAYVERIEIRGNTVTRDYVIRREFDIAEGDAFNQEMIAEAKRRLDRLGFFSNVSITTAPGSAPDRVVIVVDVQDQSTGSFGIGAGYVTGGEGFVLEASVEDKNFLGRGQYIRVAASGGAKTRNYSLSFTEPYFLGYRLAAGFDIFKTTNSTESNYAYETEGFTLRLSAPITDNLSANAAYNYTRIKYTSSSLASLSAPYQDVVNNGPWTRSSVSTGLSYNSLDDLKQPHEGFIGTLTQEIAGLGGTSHFYKLSGKLRYYQTISDDADIIGSVSVGGGIMKNLSGSAKVFDQFKIGSDEIRGFSSTGIGPRMSNGDVLGGTTYFTASTEATFPVPAIPPEYGLRGAVFADAATLYGNSVNLGGGTANGIGQSWRASVGASVIWASPFGPLRFDYAIPVKKQSFDEVERFKFGIQTNF